MDRESLDGVQGQVRTAGLTVADGQIMSAGAYVLLDGRFVFTVGPTPRRDSLAIVRLGGHREPGESPWACAAREAQEEASLRIRPLAPPDTYWFQVGSESETLKSGPPPGPFEEPAAPVLTVCEAAGQASVMYLAAAEGDATPATETRGLLLLSPTEIVRLVCTRVTLGQYRQAGGRAILLDDLPEHLPLDSYLQLRLLAVLLLRHPDLAGASALQRSAHPYRA